MRGTEVLTLTATAAKRRGFSQLSHQEPRERATTLRTLAGATPGHAFSTRQTLPSCQIDAVTHPRLPLFDLVLAIALVAVTLLWVKG